MASETALLELGLLFAAVGLVGALATRIDQSVIPFYILAGMVLNPFVAGRVAPISLETTPFVELGAEVGIVLLLLFLGLEFNLDRLLADRARISAAGAIDFAINFGVGLLLGYVLFRAVLPAFLIAGAVYISSSAIISKSLIDLGWIANDEASPILGTLVAEDLLIALYLVVASAMLAGGSDLAGTVQSMGVAVGFMLGLLVVVHYGTPVFEALLETNSREFLVLRALGLVVPIAGLGLLLGVSEAVAAFFVGMAFSATGHVSRVETLLEPVRDVFAAIFFFWIGLVTDPLLLGEVLGLIVLAVLLTTPTKLVSGYLGGRIYGLNPRRSTRVALGMTTRGEFTLIIAALALSGAGGVLSTDLAETIYAFAVGYVLVMSLLGTTLMQYATPIENAVSRRFA
ncbi:sodium/hydrogen exchanger [Halodesulfurarchaeum formicicum]|uniref:Sodium/hydrogen exchanger n=1 Tax=Halodesulfurarchaeum formicicum TaxID=1873524 RepID=A0A1D8S2H9_9EURY|nr:cation:proton antiporter [Halodesulfurarchaeum formicicum]AOW79568.1 sodium/hydrogen exchanger [Halodesulfurarchaeum formicicum]